MRIYRIMKSLRLCPRFELKHRIREGSESTIFHAVDCDMNPYVVKRSPLTSLGLKREIKILKKLNHQSIIKSHHTWTCGIYRYLALDSYECDLLDYINNKKTTDVESVKIILQLAKTVQWLANRRILHLDIKPENILLNRKRMLPVLCDFGSSVSLAPNQKMLQENVYIGTDKYMAPEMKKRTIAGKPNDVWGIGICGFMLCTQSMPRDDRNAMKDVLNRCMIDDELINIIYSSLHSDPQYRMTIDEMVDRLQQWTARS